MTTRAWIAAMIYPMINAVLFGIGIVPVLAIPSLADHLWTLIPLVMAASFLVAAPIAWIMAPRLRLRHWQGRAID